MNVSARRIGCIASGAAYKRLEFSNLLGHNIHSPESEVFNQLVFGMNVAVHA